MVTIPATTRVRMALVGCVALLGIVAFLVDSAIPAWAYPLFNTAAAAALIALALTAGSSAAAIGLTIGRRTIVAAAIGLASVAAVLAAAWALPHTREVFTSSPAPIRTLPATPRMLFTRRVPPPATMDCYFASPIIVAGQGIRPSRPASIYINLHSYSRIRV